jgi:alpha-beta hydrolase superfamily lysophospholipase
MMHGTPPQLLVANSTGQQTMPDGQRLFVRDWPLPHAAAGAVLIVHGLGEHSGRYARLARWFRQRGYAVRSYDQRGHGRTAGQRGAIRRADDLVADLGQVYAAFARLTPAPPLLLGHSMGGVVALRAVLDQRVAPPALVLSSPALRSWEPPWVLCSARVLDRVLPRLPLRNHHPKALVSHDPQVRAAYRSDPLRTRWITPRLANFIFRAGAACIADAARLATPTLLLAAGDDMVVDPAGSRQFAVRGEAGGRLTARIFPELYHEVFNEAEPWRSRVLAELEAWLAASAASRTGYSE